MLSFLGALNNRELGVLVFARKHGLDDAVDSGLRRLLLLKVTHETVYGVFRAFQENFYSCVAPVAHVTLQTVLHGGSVDEGAETDSLNNARNVDFDTQMLDIQSY
jgi:hypothetical protein